MIRATTRRRRSLAAVALVLLGTAVLPGIARGDEIGDKRAKAAAIAAKIEGLNGTVERYAEEANGAQLEVDDLNRQAAVAQARADAAQAQMDEHRGELNDYAVDAYVRGDADEPSARAASVDANNLGLAQGYLAAASKNRQQLIDQLESSRQDVEVQVAQLESARAGAEVKTKVLNDSRANAQSAVDEQAALYQQAQGELATLLQQEQARLAQERAAAATQRAQQATAANRAPSGTLAAPDVPGRQSPQAIDPGPAPSPNGNVDAVIARAKAQLGKPYVWGAAGPDSFDCSGLTMYAWQAAGVSLPHYTGSQYAATRHISLDQLQPGDLVFYHNFGHENMYIGNGQVIDAPHSGAYVQIVSLYWIGQPELASRPG
ncbi:MAG: NlpC/P60 family protein [Acidimicrobiales bacterium]